MTSLENERKHHKGTGVIENFSVPCRAFGESSEVIINVTLGTPLEEIVHFHCKEILTLLE